MRLYHGYVRMNHIEFEVEDEATDLEVEQAFNDAIDATINMGFGYDVDYDYEEVDRDEEEEA